MKTQHFKCINCNESMDVSHVGMCEECYDMVHSDPVDEPEAAGQEQPPILKPVAYQRGTGSHLPYGRYLVIRKDGKTHLETYNGTGWAYNDNAITFYYLPKIS